MSETHPAPEAALASVDQPHPPQLLERLLSPQGIHALLGAGGLLFVIGLITWLATLGIFDHPLVLATALGAGNLILLGAGFWLVLNTRYQLAGLALTLLACLVMPLHLWFYHSQQLLTLDNHLWAAALVISLLYALTARVLKNFWFVPVFLGGVAMTCLLILANLQQFWQITAPAITLCVLGLVAIHAERLFTEEESSPFRRARFGLAFFWSGHALLGLGLLMVLVAQLAGGPLYASFTKPLYEQWKVTPTDLVTTTPGKLTALFLVLAGIYAHLYSDLVVRRKGYYLQIAAVLFLWVELMVIDLLNIPLEKETLLGILAGTGLIIQLLHRGTSGKLPAALPILPFLASILCLGASIGGLLLYFADSFRYLEIGQRNIILIGSKLALILSMIVACLANTIGWWTTGPGERFGKFYRDSAWMTGFLVVALGMALQGPASWWGQTWSILALGAVAVLIAWRWAPTRSLGQFAHVFVAFWLLLGIPHYLDLGTPLALSITGLLTAAAGYYLLTVLLLAHLGAIPFALICALVALVHFFAWFDFALAYKMLACAVLGAVFTFLGIYFSQRTEREQRIGKILTHTGQFVFFISMLATALLGIQTLLASLPGQPVWSIFYALLIEAGLAFLFYWFRSKDAIHKIYLAFALAHLVLAGLLMVTLLQLPPWRKLELASVGLGVGLTILGFLAWTKEGQDKQRQDSVSPMLLLGNVLIGIPLAWTVTSYRSTGQFMIWDEASMLIVGLVLLAAGCICQLRIPAIAGAILTVLYLAGLLIYVPWGHLGTASLILAGGGAAIFLLGLALSIFRDQLLALPAQVKERKGVFQVLGWR